MKDGLTAKEAAAVAFVNAHKEDMLALWEKLVSTESPSADKAGVNRVGDILASRLEAFGAEVKRVEVKDRGDILFAEYNKTAPGAPVLFCGHMDTVFPAGTIKERPFRTEGGRAFGPGVLDMKGGLTAAVFALGALASCGFADRPVRIVFMGDEEEGHRNSDAKEKFKKLIQGAGAALNFETASPAGGIVVGRKGSCRLRLEVTGVSAHAGNAPEAGRSAILEAAHKVIAIQALNDLEHGTSVNVGIISGGTVVNAIPGSCRMDIDIRYTEKERLSKTLEEIRRIAAQSTVPDTSCVLTEGAPSVTMETSSGITGLFEKVREASEALGLSEPFTMKSGGWSDANLIATEGIPVVCGMGVKGENNHTPREYAIVDSLFERAALAAVTVMRL